MLILQELQEITGDRAMPEHNLLFKMATVVGSTSANFIGQAIELNRP